MSARVSVKLDYAPLMAELQRLPALLAQDVVLRGVRFAVKPIEQRARQLVQQPGKPGYYQRWNGTRPDVGEQSRKGGQKMLRDTITHTIKRYDSGVIVAVVGPAWPSGNHGHLVEKGHRIAVKGTLRVATGSRKGYAPAVTKRAAARGHKTGGGIIRPWAQRTRALPFMQPAVEQSKADVQRRFAEKLKREIARLWPQST